jgi:hypothetical protein
VPNDLLVIGTRPLERRNSLISLGKRAVQLEGCRLGSQPFPGSTTSSSSGALQSGPEVRKVSLEARPGAYVWATHLAAKDRVKLVYLFRRQHALRRIAQDNE